MNTLQLNKTLHCLPHFVGTFPCDQLPLVASRPCSYVINLDDSSKDGSHWVALYVDLFNNATYFDSFGISPLVEEVLTLMNRLSRNQWTFNEKRLQDIRSNACGYYCTLFLLLIGRGLSLNEFQDLFSDDYKLNDLLVKEFIHSYVEKHEHSH